MIQLQSKKIQPASKARLKSLQTNINSKRKFSEKVSEANNAWRNKNGSAFIDIKDRLLEMCVGVKLCAYCESNEATDIEHIFPKRLYPEKTFNWNNYILACNKCNSHCKSDKFKIFYPSNSIFEVDISPRRGTGIAVTKPIPFNYDSLFINQRKENPLDFMQLDLEYFLFTESAPLGTRDYYRAKFTIEVLELNLRDTLVEAREHAYGYYLGRLEKYVAAKKATNIPQLHAALVVPLNFINITNCFQAEKERVLKRIKKTITRYHHPTVWKEMIRQKNIVNEVKNLVNQVPEVISWN